MPAIEPFLLEPIDNEQFNIGANQSGCVWITPIDQDLDRRRLSAERDCAEILWQDDDRIELARGHEGFEVLSHRRCFNLEIARVAQRRDKALRLSGRLFDHNADRELPGVERNRITEQEDQHDRQ